MSADPIALAPTAVVGPRAEADQAAAGMHAGYRPDIDGLRAVAVTAVLAYHAFPSIVPGGYVGVDVFFVISGYLITGILLRELQEERFSVLRFYVRRARRLFPALLAVLGATLALGAWWLLPGEFRALGKHVLSGAGFVSNLTLWRESGYFDTSSELKPLLHLWSLAVEEQYYLVWPLLLWLLVPRGGRTLVAGIAGLAVLSFALSAVATAWRPEFAFYAPVTRFWELAAGGALAVLQARTGRGGQGSLRLWVPTALGAAGFAMVALAIVGFDRHTPFPGTAALLPVAGSVLLIAAGPASPVNRWVLSHRISVGMGLISYPLYLWHWPLLAYARVLSPEDVPASWRAMLMLLAVVLAWATYRWIEAPMRQRRPAAAATRDAVKLWAALAAAGAVGAACWWGLVAPRSAALPHLSAIDAARGDWDYPGDRQWRGDRRERVLFVGDSHMEQYAPRLARLFAEHAQPLYSAQLRTDPGCAPIAGVDRRSLPCARFADDAFRLARDPAVRTVVFAASWAGFTQRDDVFRVGDAQRRALDPLAPAQQWIFDDWSRQLAALVRSGKRVVVLLSSPRGPLVDPAHLVSRGLIDLRAGSLQPVARARLQAAVAPVDERVRAAAVAAGAEVVETFDAFCDARSCPVVFDGDAPIFVDESHVRARYAAQRLRLLDRYVRVTDATAASTAAAPAP